MKKSALILILLFAFGCSQKEDQNTLKVAATAMPHAEMLNHIKPDLESQGVNLKIIVVDDYNIPNRLLSEKEVDANFFQHIPFLENQIKNFGYPIQCQAQIHLAPMAIYSKKYKTLAELPEGATISLPNDPTNEYRALSILVSEGLITLRPGANLQATAADIQSNPKKFKFREIDAALTPRTLGEVDAAAINTNYALQAGLNPMQDALAMESKSSPYANIIAIRDADAQDPRLEKLKAAMLSDKMRAFILEKYRGAIIPILEDCPSAK